MCSSNSALSSNASSLSLEEGVALPAGGNSLDGPRVWERERLFVRVFFSVALAAGSCPTIQSGRSSPLTADATRQHWESRVSWLLFPAVYHDDVVGIILLAPQN